MNNDVLIIIDANGQYDKNTKSHVTISGAMVDEEFYKNLINEIRSGKYKVICYKINLPECDTKQDVEKALEIDPILSKLSEEEKKKMFIFKSGYRLAQEFDDSSNLIYLENELAKKGYSFVIAGLYYDWCVEVHKNNLISRHPNVQVSSNKYLSRRSSSMAKDDHKNGSFER